MPPAVHPPSLQPSGGAFGLARRARGVLRRVPVWAWRALMHSLGPSERTRFNAEPVTGVDYFHDIDFVGDSIRAHRLDVITPAGTRTGAGAPTVDDAGPLPVYVYFHGGAWTSGDKAALRGLVQHCSVVDFSVFFEKGFVLSLDFVRMLLPRAAGGRSRQPFAELRHAAGFLSPIEWLDARFPPVFLTTSERDFFYAAN